MADLPTRLELFQRWRDTALAVPSTRISPSETDREGSDLNLLGNADALTGELVVSRMADGLAGCFEDTAEGDQLDRLIFDRKGLPRKPATCGVLTFELSRPTAGAGAGTIAGGPPGSDPQPARTHTNRGTVYHLLEPVAFGPSDLGPVVVRAQAELAGLDFSVDADQAWSWLDIPFDPTIVISNPESSAGAQDEETDSEYRSRAKRFFPSLRRGTRDAIEFGTRSAAGVASANVVEPTDPDGIPNGTVDVYALDPLGQTNTALAARAQRQLLEYRALGVYTPVRTASIEYVPVRFEGSAFDANVVLDTATAKALIQARITAALYNQQPSERLLRSTIIAAAKTVAGFIFEPENLVEPAATLVPGTGVALRTRSDLVTVA